MGSRFNSHQLSNGLFVSGRPEQPKEKAPIVSSVAVPYTGGDVKKSGDLGKMFDLPADGKARKSGPMPSAPSRTGSFGGTTSHSGPVTPTSSSKKSNSGPIKPSESSKKSSGPQSGPLPPSLPTTGLITSGPLNSSAAPRKASGPLDAASAKTQPASVTNQSITVLSQDDVVSSPINFNKFIMWSLVLLFVMGFVAGIFIISAVHNPVLLIVVVILFVPTSAFLAWNCYYGRKAIANFVTHYPDAELRSARNGEFVKISGVVTCGNVPLESSFQKVPRCVFTSTSLHEYRALGSRPVNPTHRRFSWGLRHIESRAVDFYISDFQTGLRALVKTGCGSKVTPCVDDALVIEVGPRADEASPELVRWLGDRKLPMENRAIRVREGYIKEGSTVSVMGVVQRNENVLMIVPPVEATAMGCAWGKFILPGSLEGIILRCEDSSKNDVIPV